VRIIQLKVVFIIQYFILPLPLLFNNAGMGANRPEKDISLIRLTIIRLTIIQDKPL
jgi:hypothetical protein